MESYLFDILVLLICSGSFVTGYVCGARVASIFFLLTLAAIVVTYIFMPAIPDYFGLFGDKVQAFLLAALAVGLVIGTALLGLFAPKLKVKFAKSILGGFLLMVNTLFYITVILILFIGTDGLRKQSKVYGKYIAEPVEKVFHDTEH